MAQRARDELEIDRHQYAPGSDTSATTCVDDLRFHAAQFWVTAVQGGTTATAHVRMMQNTTGNRPQGYPAQPLSLVSSNDDQIDLRRLAISKK